MTCCRAGQDSILVANAAFARQPGQFDITFPNWDVARIIIGGRVIVGGSVMARDEATDDQVKGIRAKSFRSGQTGFHVGIIVQVDVDDGALRVILRVDAQGIKNVRSPFDAPGCVEIKRPLGTVRRGGFIGIKNHVGAGGIHNHNLVAVERQFRAGGEIGFKDRLNEFDDVLGGDTERLFLHFRVDIICDVPGKDGDVSPQSL